MTTTTSRTSATVIDLRDRASRTSTTVQHRAVTPSRRMPIIAHSIPLAKKTNHPSGSSWVSPSARNFTNLAATA